MSNAESISVDINNESNYILTGNINALLNNSRAMIALRRLDFNLINDSIKISFTPDTKIAVWSSIEQLAEKVQVELSVRQAVEDMLGSYGIERDNFNLFASKAMNIRNNEFGSKPELVDDFRQFKNILSSKMARTLYDLQMLSAFHMAFSQNACNFAVPGAGKTSIVYGAYTYLKSLPKEDPKHVDMLLVIGPLSSFAPWEKEYKKCFGVPAACQRLSGDSTISLIEKEKHLYSSSPKELTLMNHAGLKFLKLQVIDFLKQNKVLVVVDEAHRIKNADGIWGRSAIEIAKEATSRVVLTGTPAPNGYEDLFNLVQFIYPYKYKDILNIHYGQLRELTKIGASLDNPRVARFIEGIKPFFIRIKKTDLKLPPIREEVIYVNMDSLQRKIYDFIEEKYISHFENKASATAKDALNRARLIRLRQAAVNPKMLIKPLIGALEDDWGEGGDPNSQFAIQYDEGINDSEIFKDILTYAESTVPPKFVAVQQIYNEKIRPTRGKLIVWTIFIQNAEELQRYLNSLGIKSKLLIGRVPQNEREVIVELFNDPDNNDFDVVIANPFSVSESISLHEGCHNAVYMERDYNASNFLQSKDRIHRVGLDEEIITNYYYLVSPASVDEVVHEKLSDKVKRMEEIINEEIPLFQRIHDNDETDIITSLLYDYANRT